MKHEYRVTTIREGGKKQYRTFQRHATLLRYVTSLTNTTRDDLKPIVFLECTSRTVGPWHAFDTPGIEKPNG